jgi:hypothetical protein
MQKQVLKGRAENSHYFEQFSSYCNDATFNKTKRLVELSDFNTFNQAASEAMVYYFFKHNLKQPKTSFDVKVADPPNKKDVDVVAEFPSDFTVCVEVKAPDFDAVDAMEHLRIANRAGNSPEAKMIMERSCADFQKVCAEAGQKIKIDKLDDLKIKSYLESANQKFGKVSEANAINALFISADTEKMCDFFRYCTNELTGFLSKDPYINVSLFSNVDYLVLSNSSEAHLDDNFVFNPWDLSNYLCIVLPLKSHDASPKRLFVDGLFQSKLVEIASYVRKTPENLPTDMLIFNYIALNYPQFCVNEKLRKYR